MYPNPHHTKRPDEPPLALYQLIDRDHGGVVVAVLDYPAGWQASSEVVWNYQQCSFPVISYAHARNPKGVEAFTLLPTASFFWITPALFAFCRQGDNVLGQIAMPPMSALDAMKKLIIPRHRGKCQGLRVLGVRSMPHLAQDIGADLKGLPSEGVGVKIEYVEQGRPIEEEFYGLKAVQDVPNYGPMGMLIQHNWYITWAFCFRAEKGRLDAHQDLFWRMARSIKVNPLWEQLHAEITQQLKAQFDQYIAMGYSQIQAAGQLSRAISANNDAMLARCEQQRVAERQASQAARAARAAEKRSPADKFDDYIRGVAIYEDPYYGESQQDANYAYHWTDGYGNYKASNNYFFNPNIGSNQNWILMQRKY